MTRLTSHSSAQGGKPGPGRADPTQRQAADKSLYKALACSALVPGSGSLYAGRADHALLQALSYGVSAIALSIAPQPLTYATFGATWLISMVIAYIDVTVYNRALYRIQGEANGQ
jgi:hypothetical protein